MKVTTEARPVVLIPMSADILHHGHMLMLNRAKRLGRVVVALGSDRYQRNYKREPIQPYMLRKATLEAFGVEVVERDLEDMRRMALELDADFLCVGSDWGEKLNEWLWRCGMTWEWCAEHGVTVVVFPNEGLTSTTKTIEAVRGHLERAAT